MAAKLVLSCLRARMGDWIYYICIVPFEECAKRISLADEIHRSKGLSSLIQREVSNRTVGIVEYLKTQDQRFFNAIIVGIYGGNPHYQEISIEPNDNFKEEEIISLNNTFGVLTLSGEEKLFAIDGQHRVSAIKETLKQKNELKNEELTVIFVAHKNTDEGLIRTRRLFSTLNRYAKPVNKNEIIAIDEEDNCAIITRRLLEEFSLFDKIISFSKSKTISKSNKSIFTNIIMLYDFVTAILTDKPIFGIKVTGEDHKMFTQRRVCEKDLRSHQLKVESIFKELFEKIPSFKNFLKTKRVDRQNKKTSLFFRPIGQNILYSLVKICIDKDKKKDLYKYLAEDTFNLRNRNWQKVFIDDETKRLKTDKTMQRFALLLILKKLDVKVSLSDKDKEVFNNFNIKISEV